MNPNQEIQNRGLTPLKPDELCRLIETHTATLILYARQWNTDDAEDVVQEAFLRLVRRAQWEGKPENPPAWLFAAVRNEAIDRIRKTQRRQKHERQAAGEQKLWFETPPDAALQWQEQSNELLNALDTLPLEHREIVIARIWGGLTFDEIAGLTQSPRTTGCRRFSNC